MDSNPTFETSSSVRQYLIQALRIDLIGPTPIDEEYQHEGLPYAPSKWYMTGFLVPVTAPIQQRAQDTEEEPDELSDSETGADDAAVPERGSGKRSFYPSSIGMSTLVDTDATQLKLAVTWGDYAPEARSEHASPNQSTRGRIAHWKRKSRSAELSIDLQSTPVGEQVLQDIPESRGLKLACLIRKTTVQYVEEKKSVRAVSLFVVNHRTPTSKDEMQDTAFAFQVNLMVTSDKPLIPRYDPRGVRSDDWDDRLADLHYRDAAEYAVGHNVSVHADIHENKCHTVHTEWMPQAAVERIEPSQIPDVEFGMEPLGNLDSAEIAHQALNPLVHQYQNWIEEQRAGAQQQFSGKRLEVTDELIRRAKGVANRIQTGIDLLKEAKVLEAFRIANRAMAASARRRMAQEQNSSPEDIQPPKWRPFQLAYILMNLRGIADPTHSERETVDLLFFPTGGGKTEAYLGLAAFTMVLRRLRHPEESGYRGLTVLMRYTLRLLTLDQLGRAAALICALELEREQNPEQLGQWPFEIGLWVGRAATPNYMGKKGDSSPTTARAKTMRFQKNTSHDPPLPLDRCPWCGTKFNKYSFRLHPNSSEPTDLRVFCVNRGCKFSKNRHLPVVAVDEPIYKRLPALMIATVDKFAAMPWSGETAGFFRGLDPANPRPPDLIIQDELHLISGPLGTMVGLYETAIDHLCQCEIDGKAVRPKIIASTATVRLARKQIQALFGRSMVEVFPAPGIDRRDSFFAEQVPQTMKNPRLYLGISAQGRGPKVMFLRSMITLMAAAQFAWEAAKGSESRNPADPYMTVVAYFNALRELGSARRITEDEIRSRLQKYRGRTRLDEPAGLFVDRQIGLEPVELTSRVGTASVAEAKRKLSLGFDNSEHVDVALATNMISVGLDITRLGLMVVSGQPKSTSEYIQATSRVGRDADRPGLVVTLLNLHRPRDRSHYEHFSAWHESFYRGVEATSVTPFSPRALDRGLPAVTVALARLGIPELTPMKEASKVEYYDEATRELAKVVGQRAQKHKEEIDEDRINHIICQVKSLIDDWAKLAHKAGDDGVTFGYARRGEGVNTPLLREMIIPDQDQLNQRQRRFRAPRSLRDVEPGVLLRIDSPEGRKIKQ